MIAAPSAYLEALLARAVDGVASLEEAKTMLEER